MRFRVYLRVRPKTFCSCSCPPEADDRIGEMNEGKIVAGMNFIANLQAAEKVMPTVRPLDHPAVSFLPSPPRGWCNAAIGNVGNVTSPLCRESDVVKVVTLIAAQMLFDLPRRRPVDDERVQRRPETFLSWTLAPESLTPSGIPWPSTTKCRFVPSFPRSVGFLPVSSPLLPVRRPSRCPATATSSQCPYSGHTPANRVSRAWQKLPLWPISGNARGLRNRSRTRVGASSTGIRSLGHTEFR